jgi:dephospho-CoA kinase
MLIIGLTGGIASGKSFVVKYLEKLKIPVHDSDRTIDLLYKEPSKIFLKYLKENNFRGAVIGEKINKSKNKKIIFLDMPLLFEKNLQKECDFICSTIASLKTREKRALQRPGMSKRLFNLIVKTQAKNIERKSGSHFIINTQGDRSKTYLQVDNMIYYILSIKK